jgi:hypothetical protein
MLDDHARAMQVKLCEANIEGVTRLATIEETNAAIQVMLHIHAQWQVTNG